VKLGELIARVRTLANDKTNPPLWSDAEIAGWLDEGVVEAAVRGRLLYEKNDPWICEIPVDAGIDTCPLHPSLYEIAYLAFKENKKAKCVPLRLVSTEFLDVMRPEWREIPGTPEFAIQKETTLRLAPVPDCDGLLWVEGYRLPSKPMRDRDDIPEIHQASHIHLVQWALHKGFSVPDAELFDPQRSALAEQEFTRYFGIRPDSDLRRITREDVPHHVKAFWV
jgi:hypothetical protein